jgi:hypothetical protein
MYFVLEFMFADIVFKSEHILWMVYIETFNALQSVLRWKLNREGKFGDLLPRERI